MSFPIWKHHPEHKAKLIHSQEELDSLEDGWVDESSCWRKELLQELPKEEILPVVELKQEEQAVEPEQKVKKGKKAKI